MSPVSRRGSTVEAAAGVKSSLLFWGGLFGLAAGLNVLLGWHAWPAVFGGALNDPDSYMRLLRLRQGIAAGHLTNIVAGDDGGAGVLVEWSRLLDLLLWALAAPLVPVLGWTSALFVAGVVSGPLFVGALGVALAFAARPVAEDGLLWAAAAAAALLPGLADFAAPGVVHYHMLLLALIAGSGGCVLRACRSGSGGMGFFAGLIGGLAIWLTPETMPFILMGFAALLFRWLGPGQPARMGAVMLACAAGFVDVLGFGYAIDPPQGGYLVAEIDRLSIVYVLLGVLLLGGAQVLQRLPRWRRFEQYGRIAGLAVMAAMMLAWVVLYPKVAEGPYGLMGAEDRRRFFGAMLETRPLHGTADVLALLLPGVLALGYALWRAAAARGGWPWLYVAVWTLVMLVLADRFLLFTEFPAGMAAALLPVALSEVSQRWRGHRAAAMAARLIVLAAVLLLPKLPALARQTPPSPRGAFPTCDLRHIGRLLGSDKGVIVLAEAQDTPELLYRTPVLTVGSLYQHGVSAYLKSWAAWRGLPGAGPGASEPAAVRATAAKLVLFCPSHGRYGPVQDLPVTTLWDVLEAGKPPPWLALRNADPASGWRVYAVRD